MKIFLSHFMESLPPAGKSDLPPTSSLEISVTLTKFKINKGFLALKLVSAIFYQILFFHEMIVLQKL